MALSCIEVERLVLCAAVCLTFKDEQYLLFRSAPSPKSVEMASATVELPIAPDAATSSDSTVDKHDANYAKIDDVLVRHRERERERGQRET